MKTLAIYAGSFDPLTLGHAHVIQEGLGLFDMVLLAVGENPAKRDKYMFTVAERQDMLEKAYWRGPWRNRVAICMFSGKFLIHEAIDRQCSHIIRGIRNARDLEEEMAMAQMNAEIAKTHRRYDASQPPSTVFIPTPPHLALVSSSMVKSLIGYGDWQEQIKRYVTQPVYDAILNKVTNASA